MKRALSLAYLALSLAALASGAERCGQVADCVIDVGRACAKEHLPLRIERAAAAKVVAARNAHVRGRGAGDGQDTYEAPEFEERAPLQAPAGGALREEGRGARPLKKGAVAEASGSNAVCAASK